jgi:integrase
MKNSSPTHLYRYQDSQNYFIRFRMNSFKNIRYIKPDGYFVASLRTSSYDDAKWLAFYIKRNLMKEISMECFSNNTVKSVVSLGDKLNSVGHLFQHEPSNSNTQFKALLRQRFTELLKVGKLMLEHGLDQYDNLQKPLSEEQMQTLRDMPGQLVSLSEQLAMLEMVSNKRVDVSIDSEHKYLDYRDMVNALTHQLDEFKTQLADYRLEATGSVQSCTSEELHNFTIAMADQNQVKVRLDQQQANKQPDGVNFYSIDNQLSLFLQEKSRTIDEDTIEGYRSKFSVFFETVPAESDCRSITKQHVQHIKTALLARKSNASKGCSDKFLNPKTINGYLSNYSTFFSYLEKNVEGIDKNPFSGVSIAKNEMNSIKRRPFTESEIKQLLAYKPMHGSEARAFRQDAEWFVPVAVYTGMRLNEISEITLDSIKQVDDIWCFDLTLSDVKNMDSRRLVPIAQTLLDMGLLNYANKLRSEGKSLLFFQIRKGKKKAGKAGWGDPISRWFNRTVLKNIGIDFDKEEREKKSVVFHSLRHTFVSTCVKKGEQKHLIKRIVGHAQDDEITLGTYSDVNEIDLKLLKELIDRAIAW